jgi:triosephosphate isomerase
MDQARKVVAGNWKMNKTLSESLALVQAIRAGWSSGWGVETVVCPPYTAIRAVADALAGSGIGVGAQNAHWEASGAFTGEISIGMLKDAGCRYVILGHSERRQYFGETDETVNRRLKAVLGAGLQPIVCVGETLAERDGGLVESVIERQVRGALAGLDAVGIGKLILAYEPVWAIGTGRNATPQQAQDVHAFLRGLLGKIAGPAVAASVPLQYGGSVKASNAGELFGQRDINGGLIGGAALDAQSFLDIVKAAG